MEQYKVFFKKSVEKDFKGIPKDILFKILDKIKNLQDDPRPTGSEKGSEKLTGQERYRIRQETYRIVYSIQDLELTVWVVKIGHRREIP